MSSPYFRYADTVGDGSGDWSGVGDFSTTARELLLKPAEGKILAVARMLVTVEDSGSFDAEHYGNGIVLTNGIALTAQASLGKVDDYTTTHPIMRNADWASYCFDVDIKAWGVGTEFLMARWTFGKSGKPIMLDSRGDDYLKITLNDDFSGLESHKFHFQGIEYRLEER